MSRHISFTIAGVSRKLTTCCVAERRYSGRPVFRRRSQFGSIGHLSHRGCNISLGVQEHLFFMYATLALIPQELPLLLREYKAGIYSVHLYYAARMILLVRSCFYSIFPIDKHSWRSKLTDAWLADWTDAVHRYNILAGGTAPGDWRSRPDYVHSDIDDKRLYRLRWVFFFKIILKGIVKSFLTDISLYSNLFFAAIYRLKISLLQKQIFFNYSSVTINISLIENSAIVLCERCSVHLRYNTKEYV